MQGASDITAIVAVVVIPIGVAIIEVKNLKISTDFGD